nr:hypothetical protein [Sulfurimicrobium lacus]
MKVKLLRRFRNRQIDRVGGETHHPRKHQTRLRHAPGSQANG